MAAPDAEPSVAWCAAAQRAAIVARRQQRVADGVAILATHAPDRIQRYPGGLIPVGSERIRLAEAFPVIRVPGCSAAGEAARRHAAEGDKGALRGAGSS